MAKAVRVSLSDRWIVFYQGQMVRRGRFYLVMAGSLRCGHNASAPRVGQPRGVTADVWWGVVRCGAGFVRVYPYAGACCAAAWLLWRSRARRFP